MNKTEKEITRIALRHYIVACEDCICNDLDITDLQLITNRNLFNNIAIAKNLIGELI